MTRWTTEVVEATLAAQGIALASGRAERIAAGIQPLLEAAAKDPLRDALEFETDPTRYLTLKSS